MKKYFLSLIAILLYAISLIAQEKKYSDIYDLNFKMQADSTFEFFYPWKPNHTNAFDGISKNPQDPYFMRCFIINPFMKTFESVHYHQILMPEGEFKKADLSLTIKGNKIKSLKWEIEGLDSQENAVFKKSETFDVDTVFHTIRQQVALSDVVYLKMALQVTGEKESNAHIFFKNTKIDLDGKSIDDFPVRVPDQSAFPVSPAIQPLNMGQAGFSQIEEFNKGDIIGLGETVHGNKSINSLVDYMIRDQILSGNTQLVLLERPIWKIFSLNRYIRNLDIDSSNVDFLDEKLRPLIDFLKQYNAGKENSKQVRLGGVDVSPENMYFFDYLINVNKSLNSSLLDQLAILVMENKMTEVRDLLNKQQDSLEQLLTKEDFQYLSYAVNQAIDLINSGSPDTQNRDSVMSVNSAYFIDHFNPSGKKVFIYAHTVHLNPKNTYPTPPCTPLGGYLKEIYKDRYRNFLLTSDGGKIKVRNVQMDLVNKSLSTEKAGSIEAYLKNRHKGNALYLPMTSDFDQVMLFRMNGLMADNYDFFPLNLYSRYDGVFYIKNQEQTNEPGAEEIIDPQQLIMHARKQIESRTQIYNELKKNQL